jgi:hypothetical protein
LIDQTVLFSFFWFFVYNFDATFEEQSELKKLPVSETKQQMIHQSLDTFITFMKHSINNPEIVSTNIKPHSLYAKYVNFMKDIDKKGILNKNSFLTKIKEADHQTYIEQRLNVRVGTDNPTNYLFIDRNKLYELCISKNWWDTGYDEFFAFDNNGVVIDEYENGVDKTELAVTVRIEDYKSLQQENERLRRELERYKALVDPKLIEDEDTTKPSIFLRIFYAHRLKNTKESDDDDDVDVIETNKPADVYDPNDTSYYHQESLENLINDLNVF